LSRKEILVVMGIIHILLKRQCLTERNKDISHVYLDNTEQVGYHCRVWCFHASYSGGPGLKCALGHRPFWLRF
jgi:hypothetical protein